MKIKRILLSMALISNILLAGCGREINTLNIATSIGIDKIDDGYLMTLQVLNPKQISSKIVVNEPPVVIYTETGNDLFEIVRRVTEQSPRKTYLSHLRTMVLGEDVARDGIEKILDLFTHDHEFRTDFGFFVAKGTTANKILNTITPMETVSGMAMFNSLSISEKTWAPVRSVKILDLVNDILLDGKNPVLPSVEIVNEKSDSNSIDTLKTNDTAKLKIGGISVFNNDKLVGWLSEDESKGYNYITDNVKNTITHVNYDENTKVTFEFTGVESKMKAYMLNGQPAINLKLDIKASINAQTDYLDFSDKSVIKKLTEIGEKKVTDICYASIRKAKEDYKCDIFGFGEEIHKAYPKLWKNLKSDWNNEFVNLPVNIDVKLEIMSLGQNTKSIFLKENE